MTDRAVTPATEPLTAQGQYIVDDWATGDTQRKQLTEQVLASEAAAGSRATEGLRAALEALLSALNAEAEHEGVVRVLLRRLPEVAAASRALATGAASPAEPAKPSARSLVCSIGEHTKCDGHAPNGDLGYPCSCNCHTLSPIPAQPASEPEAQLPEPDERLIGEAVKSDWPLGRWHPSAPPAPHWPSPTPDYSNARIRRLLLDRPKGVSDDRVWLKWWAEIDAALGEDS